MFLGKARGETAALRNLSILGMAPPPQGRPTHQILWTLSNAQDRIQPQS